MTSIKSGWFVQTLLSSFSQVTQSGTPTTLNFATSTNDAQENISLTGTGTTDYTQPINYASATLGVWTNAQEVTSTSNWPTGGVVLSTAYSGADVVQGLTNPATTPANLVYTWTHPVTVANTTIASGIYGFIIYFPNITAPLSKPELLAIYVGTGYTTVAGTLTITPSGSGLSVLTFSA